MESFYGGKNGKSFEIRKIFTTKYKTPNNLKPAVAPKRGYDSMEEDLIKGWTSNISIGEFVVISYGYQDDDGYEIYKQTDILSQDKRNYNSSLWQKIYTEEQQNGQTIRGVAYAFISQMTGSTPWFLLGDANDPTKPMPLPKESLTKVLDADQPPVFWIDNDKSHIDNPIMYFALPQAWNFESTVDVTQVAPDAAATASLNNSTTDEHNIKKLALAIPRGVKFYYGDKLGEKQDTILSDSSFADFGVGDYYINEATGFIYQVQNITGTTGNFKYIACIQAPLPTVDKTPISPYKQNGDNWEQNDPEVIRTLSADGTTWELDFSLPKAPLADLNPEFVGSTEAGSADVSIKDANTLLFNFTIPAGAKIFSGLTQPTTGAKPGDIFLHSNTGKVYQLALDKVTWEEKDGTLKGDVGNALNIVASYELIVTDTYKDTLANSQQYIIDNYTGTISPEDIFAITWKYKDGSSVAYWCFRLADGTWNRVQLTGGIGNIMENSYNDTSPDNENKVYTAAYVNSLIGQPLKNTDEDERTTFSKQQLMEMMTWGHWDSTGTLT